MPFDILEIQAKTGHNLHKFPRDISLDRQWLDLFTENEQILSGVKSLSHFSFDCHKIHFVNEMGLKKQTKLMAGAVPTIQPKIPQVNKLSTSNDYRTAFTQTQLVGTHVRSKEELR